MLRNPPYPGLLLKAQELAEREHRTMSELFRHHSRHGDGVWFHLKDGRVFDARGEEAESEPAIYDTVPN